MPPLEYITSSRDDLLEMIQIEKDDAQRIHDEADAAAAASRTQTVLFLVVGVAVALLIAVPRLAPDRAARKGDGRGAAASRRGGPDREGPR